MVRELKVQVSIFVGREGGGMIVKYLVDSGFT